MVAINNLLLLAAAVVAVLAAPSLLDARATWTCINKKLNPKTNKWEDKRLVYNQAKAKSNPHQAPLSDGKTGSSYPHWFTNGYDGDGKPIKSRTPVKFGKSELSPSPEAQPERHGQG